MLLYLIKSSHFDIKYKIASLPNYKIQFIIQQCIVKYNNCQGEIQGADKILF